MKAQFKYAFRAGLHTRGATFAVIFIIDLVFLILGLFGLLPEAAKIVSVSLGGCAIAVMLAFNLVSDISIMRRMYTAPGAYIYALTPAPRRQILLASVITSLVMDVVTMAVVITFEVFLSFSLAGISIGATIGDALRANASSYLYILLLLALSLACYLVIMMIILFCAAVRKSILYGKPAGGLLTAILAIVTAYIWSLTTFIVAPFGTVSRYFMFFTITLDALGLVFYALLLLIEAAALFILTSKLLERKVNI